MKIKTFNKFNESISDINQLCKKYGIRNYTIVDGLVNVDGGVNLYSRRLTQLPVRFGIVTGFFDCGNNKLTTLEGSPKEVGGYFVCSSNKLTDLTGSPNTVGGYFDCSNNELTSLEGSPKEVYGGDFDCSNNYKLRSLEGAPELIEGEFYCEKTPVYSIFQSNDKGSIYMFNIIFESGIDMEKIEYWFSIINKPLTDEILVSIKKYYPNI
jgi:hypothetical protein